MLRDFRALLLLHSFTLRLASMTSQAVMLISY